MVRYLVEEHNVPVYRIFVMGMGNAKVQTGTRREQSSSSTKASGRPAPNRVEVSLLKNNLDQLASNSRSAAPNNSQAQQQSNTSLILLLLRPPSPRRGFFVGNILWPGGV